MRPTNLSAVGFAVEIEERTQRLKLKAPTVGNWELAARNHVSFDHLMVKLPDVALLLQKELLEPDF